MKRTLMLVLLLPLLFACQPQERGRTQPAAGGGAPAAADVAGTSPQGAPTAPIRLDYKVIGTAFVGQPVSIEVEVSSAVRDRSIALSYRVNDPRDLTLADNQPEQVSLSAIGDAPSATRQVTVVPKREGRLYLNVSAEIETEEGSLIKAISIPVQVGAARKQREVNSERKEGENGETAVSTPEEDD